MYIRKVSPLLLLTLAREDFAPAWAKIESTIRTGYYARVKRKDEMERRLAEAAPLAKGAKTRAEFDAAVDAMVAGFHDSHFDFLTDEEPGYYMMDGLIRGDKAAAMPQVGAWFRRDADGYTVQMLMEGGAAAAAGLRTGDVVRRVNGEPFTPIASLGGHVGETVTLAYRRGGREAEARVAVSRTAPLKMFLDATVRSARVIEHGGRRIGYLHLWTHANEEFAKALRDALTGPGKDVDAFVLDLRGGFGGRPYGFEEQFLPQGKTPALFAKPLVLLIDRGSRSAKELFSYDLQQAHRATLVGETTAGHVLGTYPYRVNEWSYLEIPMVDYVVKGVRLEGRGAIPDVPVSPMTGADGRDLALEKALEIAAQKGL